MSAAKVRGQCTYFHGFELTGSVGEGRKKPSMYMVTPYMDHDLSGLLENPNVCFTEPQIKCYMFQLLEGLRYLHQVLISPLLNLRTRANLYTL